MKNVKVFFFLLFSISTHTVGAQLYYYGVKSAALSDKNTELASNLFYEELKKVTLDISDMRGKRKENLDDAFYVEIEKTGKEGLKCIFVFLKDGKQITKMREYGSFYQMLVEPKDYLKAVFKEIQEEKSGSLPNKNVTPQALTHESVQGEWKAEEGISKVILMRGGRGFVIFANGASMKVTSTIEGSALTVRQVGASNASYFPTIPREAAMKGAVSAQAVEWHFIMDGRGKLSGTKKTLLINEKGEPYMGETLVEWQR